MGGSRHVLVFIPRLSEFAVKTGTLRPTPCVLCVCETEEHLGRPRQSAVRAAALPASPSSTGSRPMALSRRPIGASSFLADASSGRIVRRTSAGDAVRGSRPARPKPDHPRLRERKTWQRRAARSGADGGSSMKHLLSRRPKRWIRPPRRPSGSCVGSSTRAADGWTLDSRFQSTRWLSSPTTSMGGPAASRRTGTAGPTSPGAQASGTRWTSCTHSRTRIVGSGSGTPSPPSWNSAAWERTAPPRGSTFFLP